MSEVLKPTPSADIEHIFTHGFAGMTLQPVALADLVAARTALIANMVGDMPLDHRRFLISFERGDPQWNLLGVPAAAKLPAVRWRQQNLDKLPATKRAQLVQKLEEVLTEMRQ